MALKKVLTLATLLNITPSGSASATINATAGVLGGFLGATGTLSISTATPFTPPDVNFNADTFAQFGKQIKPQLGESRWMEVPWFLDLHEARQKAAAEGKPLFIYSSGGATGIGAC